MRKLVLLIALLAITALVLSACGGGGGGAAGAGDAARGKALYNKSTIGTKSAEGCVACHKYDEKEGKAEKAPYTKGTGARAATRVAGMSAEEYIKESITKPDAYVVEGFNKGDMYQKFSAELSAQEMADLIAYLLSEK
ncbi:MAG: c-type cytochrome [Chloroflexi bacterium]|nr:c-type cytochrome [Chloroflexota bacterium]